MTPRDEATARKVAAIPRVEFVAMLDAMDAAAQRDALYLRFRFLQQEFCRFNWPERFDLPFNEFHVSLFTRSDDPGWRYRVTTTRDVVAAPRGYAKSTISCFAQVVHAIVYDLDACIMILSSGQQLAHAQVKDVRAACGDEESPLWDIYGPIAVTGSISETLIQPAGLQSAFLVPASFGSSVRGTKHPTRGIRPTLVIVDDGERPDRVRNEEQRRIWWDFLSKDVMKLGPREGGMRLWVRGTVLHADSMLARALAHPGFRAEKWAAIITWPENPDLWEQCGRLWANLADLDREFHAREFYDLNREAMDAGVEVLDPEVEGIYALYMQIWGEGLASFLQEKQNDPRDPNAQVFVSERFARCRIEGDMLLTADGRRVELDTLRRRFMRWDPAMGNAGGDFAALVVGLRGQFGYTYLVDAWMKVAPPTAQLTAMWALCERWEIHRVSLESNGFQAMLAETFQREKAARKVAGLFWQVEIILEPSTTNKEERIAGMEPDCHNGWIQFGERIPPEMLAQFDDFPNGAHDDFPDAAEGCHKGLGGNPVAMAQDRVR